MKLIKISLIIISVITISVMVYGFTNPDFKRIICGLEGRYSDIEKMEKYFLDGDLVNIPNGYKHTYSDGSWIFVTRTDSHHGGGTVGVLESSGRMHFYFGHVCGISGEGLGISFGDKKFNPDQSKQNFEKIK